MGPPVCFDSSQPANLCVMLEGTAAGARSRFGQTGRKQHLKLRARHGQAATLEMHQESNSHPPHDGGSQELNFDGTHDAWAYHGSVPQVLCLKNAALRLARRVISEARQTAVPPQRYQRDALRFQRPSLFPLRCAGVSPTAGRRRSTVSKRFNLDRQSFEQFIAAVSLFQSLQQATAKRINEGNPPLLSYLLETLRASDSGALVLQTALERVTSLALHIVGGDRAVLWLFTSQEMICRAAVGVNFDEGHICAALRSKLQSGGAFGEDPPSKLDLMRTLEKYSGSLGSSLAIAILPGRRIAGALAVFSNPSKTFTTRDYDNLRLLAGLAQYVLAKRVAERKPHDSLNDAVEANPDTSVFQNIHATALMERSATAPLMYPAPAPEYLQQGQIEDVHVPPVVTPVALGGSANKRPQTGTELQSLSASAALAARKRLQSLRAAALDAARNSLRYVRDVRVNWIAQAAPPFAILTVMCFFLALLPVNRQPLAGSSLSATVEATTTPVTSNSGNRVNQEAAAMPKREKSTAVPVETSHLRVTDRQTAATIAELSKYELRNLRRAADYDDDQAALELGMLYELGRDFPQSCHQAAKWVTRAAENGNAAAEYNLGLRYRDGDGVDANLPQAEKWLRRALAHKNSNAERALDALPSYHPEPSAGKMAKTTPLAVSTP